MSMESSSLAPDEGVELVQQPEEGTWKNAPAAAAGRLLMSLLPTRGVGFVIAGLLFLVMLVGTWWIHLNLDAPFLLGSHSFDATRRHARLPHRARSATPPTPTPLACNDTTPRPTCRAAAVPLSPSPPPLPSTSPPPLPSASPPPLPSASPPPLPSASPPPLPSSPLLPSASPPPPSCPSYFRYIHSDLRPWSAAGITRDAVERGKPHAEFRLVVVGGRAYVETYRRSFQTRDVVTQWGIAQLLRRYPGRVPDLDLMFDCDDKPVVRAADYARTGMPSPPPLFRYCKDPSTIDILFPDWSFWGWPEINIRPWGPLMEEMKRENERVKWPQRAPYAYWKGNPHMSWARREVLRCNVSKGHEWNVRAFEQHWGLAVRNRFRDSNVAKQCLYRYKIYVEGKSWSVSEKYILACDSPMLLVTTPFQDFFSRGLVAGEHYWPISRKHICRSIKFAVDWGNKHQRDAQMMGEQGSGFAGDDLSMDRVYDYMLHVLTEYAKLLRYKPTVPEKATELSPESMASHARGLEQAFMMESMENYAADHDPCVLPPPFMAEEVRKMAERAEAVRSRIEKMEKQMVFR